MRCENCGKKNSSTSKFCSRCGKKISEEKPSDLNNEDSISRLLGIKIHGDKTPIKGRSRIKIISIFIFITMVLTLAVGAMINTSNPPNKEVLQLWLGFLFLFCFSILVIILVFEFFKTLIIRIKSIKEHPLAGIFSILFLIGIIYFSILGITSLMFPDLHNDISLIQRDLSEAAATKEIGDLLADKKTPPENYTWQEVENLAAAMASQIGSLKIDGRLAEYKKSCTIWAEKIRDAAKDQTKWKDLPAEPDSFTLTLKQKEAEDLFKDSLTNISELIQFGSDAINREDRETMRYIAAKLLAQDHWLTGLSNYKKAGFFSKLTSPAYAANENSSSDELGKKIKQTKENMREITNVQKNVRLLMQAAMGYYNAENIEKNKTASDEWIKAAEETVALIMQIDLGPQVLAELNKYSELFKNGPEEKAQLPPKAQEFKDDCTAKNGALGGVSRTNNWIATAEDGYYCSYEKDSKKCWKFLSYSGSLSDGGDVGCEQQNILPEPTGPNAVLAKTRPPWQQQQAEQALAPKTETSTQQQTPPTTAKTTAPKTTEKTPVAKTEVPPKKQTPPTTTTSKPAEPKPTTPKTPLPDLGEPTGTAALKIEFVLSQSDLTAKVGEYFAYSFCQPALSSTNDLCAAAAANPKNGLPPYSFSLESGVGFLPYGLTLNLNGLLEGTPTAEDSRTVGICAKDTGGFSVCRKIIINVEQEAAPKITIDSAKCEFVSHTTEWDPNPYWAIYKITASGTISSASQKVLTISAGKATEPPVISCGSWSSDIIVDQGGGYGQATCTGAGSTSWQYSVKINHAGPVDLRHYIFANTEDYSSSARAEVQCSD